MGYLSLAPHSGQNKGVKGTFPFITTYEGFYDTYIMSLIFLHAKSRKFVKYVIILADCDINFRGYRRQFHRIENF